MKILVIGGGAREHALAWKLSRERSVTSVWCAPGNPGIASVAKCVDADVGDPRELLGVARNQGIDLTVVGPELPLSRGIVDVFTADGRAIVGPTQAAAALESSKAFAKEIMQAAGVKTARHVSVTRLRTEPYSDHCSRAIPCFNGTERRRDTPRGQAASRSFASALPRSAG